MEANLLDILIIVIVFAISMAISIYRLLRPNALSALATIIWLAMLDKLLWIIDKFK